MISVQLTTHLKHSCRQVRFADSCRAAVYRVLAVDRDLRQEHALGKR